MHVDSTHPDGPKLVSPKVFGDDRGFFVESFNQERYSGLISDHMFCQDNVSLSQKGVLRGLHFQHDPYAQGKLVSVLSGSVYDVAVDVRPTSETFGSYMDVTLRPPERDEAGVWQWTQFWIPAGFAHGFLSLEDNTLFSYKCTNYYAPEHDAGIAYDDQDIGIVWPDVGAPYALSEKDTNHPTLAQYVQQIDKR